MSAKKNEVLEKALEEVVEELAEEVMPRIGQPTPEEMENYRRHRHLESVVRIVVARVIARSQSYVTADIMADEWRMAEHVVEMLESKIAEAGAGPVYY